LQQSAANFYDVTPLPKRYIDNAHVRSLTGPLRR
jgi:hypothetical protein